MFAAKTDCLRIIEIHVMIKLHTAVKHLFEIIMVEMRSNLTLI